MRVALFALSAQVGCALAALLNDAYRPDFEEVRGMLSLFARFFLVFSVLLAHGFLWIELFLVSMRYFLVWPAYRRIHAHAGACKCLFLRGMSACMLLFLGEFSRSFREVFSI